MQFKRAEFGEDDVIQDPSGAQASYDRSRTLDVYAKRITNMACQCVSCRNYELVVGGDLFLPSLLAACVKMGAQITKPFELSVPESSPAGDMVTYSGQFPFYGAMIRLATSSSSSAGWYLLSEPYGAALFAKGLVSIDFLVVMPWQIAEANPWV
jgi:hypothetical protein